MKHFFIVLTLLILLVSCDSGGKNVYSLKLIDGKPVVTGSENGLMWYMDDPDNPNTKLNLITYSKAEQFCNDMDYAGFTDWRLPTIDELRTIVEGFDDLEPDGRCAVSADCLTMTCLYQGQKDGNDYPCANEEEELLQGPGPDGCFFSDVWRTYCGKYWSSSSVKSVVDERVFELDFSDPAILCTISSGSSGMGYARCVR